MPEPTPVSANPARNPVPDRRRPGRTLGGLLLALTVGTLLPVLVFAAVASWLSVERERRVFEAGARERARAILTAIDAELKGSVKTLDALATARALDDGDLAAFHAEALRVLRSQADWMTINLATPDGRQVTNALRPLGTPLEMVRDRDSLETVVRTRQAAAGSLVTGPVVTSYNIPIRVPVLRDGQLRYVLTAAVSPHSFQGLLMRQGIPASWVGGILDRNNRFVARTTDYANSLGKQAGGPAFLESIAAGPEGLFQGRNLAGSRVYTPFVRSASSGWMVAIGIPADEVEAGAGRAFILMAVGTAVTLGLAFLFARLLARRIAGPISDLAEAAHSLAEGRAPIMPRLPDVREFVELGKAYSQAGVALAARDEAQERFAAMANNATVAIFLTDTRENCLFLNPAAERLTGWEAWRARGHRLDEIAGIAWAVDEQAGPGVAATQAGLGMALRAALRDGEACGGEDTFTSRAGTAFPVAFAISPVRQADVVSGAIVEARDISESRRAEAERAELLAAQTRARQEAEAANQAKDEFLAMLGHELRNPLGAISNASHLLGLVPDADARVRNARTVISRQVTHVSHLVDDLLDVARVTSGKIALNLAPLNFAEVTRGAIETLSAAGRTAERELRLRLDEVWVEGDRTRLDQIVINLVGNALRYTAPNGVIEVDLHASPHEGTDGHGHAGGHGTAGSAVLTVRDNGIGISAQALPRVFDLFYQGEHSIDRSQGGLGIGLTLVRRLAELHGGTVHAESAGSGAGALFTMRLPALAGAQVHAGTDTAAQSTGTGLRILVVEDNTDARETMAELLRAYGHQVSEAEDGPAGLQAARAQVPQLALLDIGLPGMDGYELARALRAEPALRSLRLIALTGYGQPEDAARAVAAGFDLHLTKPVEIGQLLKVLQP